MTSLRMRVVEAGARAMYEADDSYSENWEYQTEDVKVWYRRMSAIQTDAKLDCLTENLDDRDRWRDISTELFPSEEKKHERTVGCRTR